MCTGMQNILKLIHDKQLMQKKDYKEPHTRVKILMTIKGFAKHKIQI